MAKIRLTKQFDFEAAHALEGYEGKCRDLHGHSYHLDVTVLGDVDYDSGDGFCRFEKDSQRQYY